MPFPFDGKEFQFFQPDGSAIKVRGWGDQNYAVFETLDGYTIVKDPATGFFNYAKLSEDDEELDSSGVGVGTVDPLKLGLQRSVRIKPASAKAKAAAMAAVMVDKRRCEIRRDQYLRSLRVSTVAPEALPAPPPAHTVGKYAGLCILVQFPDVTGTISQAEVSAFCNKKGYTGFGNNGSVYDYYLDNSKGRMEFTNAVTPYYTAKHPRLHYTDSNIPQGVRARELIKEALTHFKSQGFDFSPLSSDNEGFVYAMSVFYAGDVVNNWAEGLWPHAWHLAVRFDLKDGKAAFDYQMTNMGSELTLATFCHENGHMVCDFPDLYDYGPESKGVGNYSLMGYAGTDEKDPVQIDGYLKFKAGWSESLNPLVSGLHAQISSDKNEVFIRRRNASEYFIVENRRQEGRDRTLPTSGLAIWHVDELGNNSNEQATPSVHYELALKQADGKSDLEHGKNYGDSGDLYRNGLQAEFGDATIPSSKWWDNTPSDLEIRDISEAGKVMTFKVL